MLSYQIDDPIKDTQKQTIEVTVDLNGEKRWCFFITPEQLASVGDWVEGTQVRHHLGVVHMIIVNELSEEIIERILNSLYNEGKLESHTIPLI